MTSLSWLCHCQQDFNVNVKLQRLGETNGGADPEISVKSMAAIKLKVKICWLFSFNSSLVNGIVRSLLPMAT